MLFLDVHAELLERFAQPSLEVPKDHLRPGHGDLEALATHVLDQNREMQLAAAGHREFVRVVGGLDPQRHVVNELALEAGPDLPRGQEAALATGERRRVHLERHAHGRLVHAEHG